MKTLLGLLIFALLASAHALPPPMPMPEQGLVLNDVNLVVPGKRLRRGMAIRVEGDTISEVSAAAPSPHSRFAGMYVLPGLVDMHVHWPALLPGKEEELFAFLYLYHGVTTVRSMGDLKAGKSFEIRKAINNAEYPGPNIVTCGYIIDGPDPLWKAAKVVSSPAEAHMLAAELKAEGADCLKVYDGIHPPVMDALREAATTMDIPLVGHVPHGVSYNRALLDDMQHMRGLHPIAPGDIPPYPFFLAQWQESDSLHVRQLVKDISGNGQAVTPTLITLDRLLASQDYPNLVTRPEYQMLPGYYTRALWDTNKGMNAARFMQTEDFDMVATAIAQEKKLIKALYDAGVPVHVGTDAGGAPAVVPGFSLHQEMALLVDAGISPRAVVKAATVKNLEALGHYQQMALTTGAPADFIVLSENPTNNIEALSSIVAVVKSGRLYLREDMDQQLNKYIRANQGFTQRNIVSPLARVMVNYLIEKELKKRKAPKS